MSYLRKVVPYQTYYLTYYPMNNLLNVALVRLGNCCFCYQCGDTCHMARRRTVPPLLRRPWIIIMGLNILCFQMKKNPYFSL